MRFRKTENDLMWERYMAHSPDQKQLRRFNDQSFDYSDEHTAPDDYTNYADKNQYTDADSSYLYDTNYSEEDGEAVILGLEPEGPVEVDDSMELVPDTDDSDGFGDMMETGVDDHDADDQEIDEVLYSDIKKLAEYSNRLLKDVNHGELETWMIAKIIKASEYVSDVWHRMDAKADFANTGVDQAEDDEYGM